MSEPPAKKTKRNYREDFIMFGFVSVDSKPMCLECGAILTNDSMKKVKLEQHQKSKHPSSVGKDIDYFENLKKRQPVKLSDFVKKMNTAKAKTLKPSYLVSEIIAKVGAPQVYGEKLVKPAMIACANEVLGKDAASTLSTIPLSNDTITRRQDEMSNFVEEKIVEILQKTKFSIQVDESTIHNQAILLCYVRFIHEDDIREEMLFIKSLPETTTGEDIFNEIMQYFNNKNIPLTNLITIASDGAAAMTGKVKGFVSRMKFVAPHIFHIHCFIHRQHLVAKNIGGDMQEALNAAIHAINFVKSNSVNDRFFVQFCENENFKTLLLHTDVRWLSKGLSLERLVNLWEPLINFLMFKSKLTHYKSQKQADKAMELLEKLLEFKSKIFYLSDIFKTVNLLNLELQGRRSDLVTGAQKIKGYMGKLKYWKKQFEKKNFESFQNFKTTSPISECISACIAHLEGLHIDFERRFSDILKKDYPLWFVDLENYEPGDENVELAEMLLDLKQDLKIRKRVDREGVFGYLSIKESHPNIFQQVEPSIISFPSTWMVESGFSAVVDVFSRKRNQLDLNSRGTIRLRLNNCIKINYDILCQKHQDQGSH